MKNSHFQDYIAWPLNMRMARTEGGGGNHKMFLHTFEPFMTVITDHLRVSRMIKMILIFGINILYAWLIMEADCSGGQGTL
jgi:hypothetical protein